MTWRHLLFDAHTRDGIAVTRTYRRFSGEIIAGDSESFAESDQRSLLGIRSALDILHLADRLAVETVLARGHEEVLLVAGVIALVLRPVHKWKGYVHAMLETQQPGMRAPAMILEVSIPVVKGMSGAPLVGDRTLAVVGILFGNRARSLVPAAQATSEEQAVALSIGQALHWPSYTSVLGLHRRSRRRRGRVLNAPTR